MIEISNLNMSRAGQNPDQSSIDAILKSLSNRPNVQTTLILSRKDGSIIRTTGASSSSDVGSASSKSYTAIQMNRSTASPSMAMGDTMQQGDDTANDTEQPSPTQRLAMSIYEFVTVSSKLAASITMPGSYSASAGGETAYIQTREARESGSQPSTVSSDEDVQLLRMRTKKHEIIIFPDPNYLCCVVQTISIKDSRIQ